MKKIVIILLAALPIFLIVVISFAGKIFSEVTHIPVEDVAFVDEIENEYLENKVIELNKGEAYQLKVKVYPELASNKKVTYTSSDSDVCTVDANGLVTAVGNKLSTAVITVKTEEKARTSRIYISVSNKKVESVNIVDNNGTEVEEIRLAVGENTNLIAVIEPLTAVNKKVSWTSDNANIVYIDQLGNINARQPGIAIITVTTSDGLEIDTCKVIVEEGTAKLAFDFSSTTDIYAYGSAYYTKITEIKITDYLVYDKDTIDFKDIVIQVNSGPAIYDSETGIITINGDQPVFITATLSDGSGIKAAITLFLE